MVPFQKIMEARKTTGLSQYFLQQGCKNGTIPHIKSGGGNTPTLRPLRWRLSCWVSRPVSCPSWWRRDGNLSACWAPTSGPGSGLYRAADRVS